METEPSTFRAQLAAVDELVKVGILGSEYCPEPLYVSWPVIDSDKLPGWLTGNYRTYGEIRLYV